MCVCVSSRIMGREVARRVDRCARWMERRGKKEMRNGKKLRGWRDEEIGDGW